MVLHGKRVVLIVCAATELKRSFHHTPHEGISLQKSHSLHDVSQSLWPRLLNHSEHKCRLFVAFCAINTDTPICCGSWAGNFLEDVFNVTPILSSLSSACLLCLLLLSRMEPLSQTFSHICKLLSCLEEMH